MVQFAVFNCLVLSPAGRKTHSVYSSGIAFLSSSSLASRLPPCHESTGKAAITLPPCIKDLLKALFIYIINIDQFWWTAFERTHEHTQTAHLQMYTILFVVKNKQPVNRQRVNRYTQQQANGERAIGAFEWSFSGELPMLNFTRGVRSVRMLNWFN